MITSTVPNPVTTPATFPHANQDTRPQTTTTTTTLPSPPPPPLRPTNLSHAHPPLASMRHAPDPTPLMLLGALFLLVGILSYALRRYLYTYHPPHVLPRIDSPAHGWRGQRLLDNNERAGEGEGEGERDCYGWPWYSSQGTQSPNPSVSPPPPPPPPQQQRRHPPAALKLARLHPLLTLHPGPLPPPLSLNLHSPLQPPPPPPSTLSPFPPPRPKTRYTNPFDPSPSPSPSPTPTPSPLAASEPASFGEEGEESPWDISLSRYFNAEGVGIRDLDADGDG